MTREVPQDGWSVQGLNKYRGDILEIERGLHTQVAQLGEYETNHVRAAEPVILVV